MRNAIFCKITTQGIIASVLVSIAGLTGCTEEGDVSFGIKSPQDRFEAACILALSERLKSPSSLKIIEVVHAPERITYDEQSIAELERKYSTMMEVDEEALPQLEMMAHEIEMTKLSIQIYDAKKSLTGETSPTKFQAIITYDADNSFGAALRDRAVCNFFSTDGEFDKSDGDEVLLNGKKNFDWEIDEIRAAIGAE